MARHPFTRFALLVLIVAGVFAAAVLWRQQAPAPVAASASPASLKTADPSAAKEETPAEPATSPITEPAPAATANPVALARFRAWAQSYAAAPAERRTAMAPEGVALAREHRAALKALIPADPQRALEEAVPMALRQELPGEVTAQLEERVNLRAFFGVLAVPPGSAAPPVRREVRTDEKRYNAHVFGELARRATTESMHVNGIAVDRELAVNPSPVRRLENGERPDPRKRVVTTCPVSGKSVPVTAAADDSLPPITDATPAVEVGDTIHYLCDGGHIRAVEENLRSGELAASHDGDVAGEGSSGGAVKPTGSVPSGWNTGPKTHLYIRVTFPDQMQDPQAEKDCYDMMRQVNDFIVENSFGKCYFLTTVTPLFVLPRTSAWYVQEDDDFAVLADARVLAKAAGYDPAQYDFDTVRYSGGPGSFGGQAYVGGKGCWLKSSSVGVACHEYGHNLGLWHANYWNTSPASAIGPGTNNEYGNSFDTMGAASAGNNHFGAYNKNVINWLTNELVTTVRQSGTYRIFTFDQPIADPARRYALKIAKDNDRNYWAELRQKFSTNTWMTSGLQITWDAWGAGGASSANGSNAGPQLLDMTPGSNDGKNDSPLVVGRTFSDFESNIHITPIGKGGTTPQSMDVVVNLGSFPGNQAPILSLAASATTVATSAIVTFTASAGDPDGDALSYAWDFGDNTFSTANAAVVTKSWSTAGYYTVRCTASDMKGQLGTRFVVVRVGAPSTFTISGNVTGPGGVPLEGVLVSNGLTGSTHRSAYTDSDGNYTISNLPAGSPTISAQRYGYTFTAGFTNPVTVGPNTAGKNFTAGSIATLTVAAFDATAAETGGNTGTFRITRTGPTASAQVVRVVNPSGTATKGTDYALAPDTTYNSSSGAYELTIPAGAAFLDVILTATNDTTQEGPELATLQLVPVSGLLISGAQQATITIDDDDTVLPRVRIVANDEFANESGDPAQWTVSRTGATTAALTVIFTRTGTASTGSDHVDIGTSVVIPAGAASAPITFTPVEDVAIEGNETKIVTLSTSAAYIVDSTANNATITLNDNDLNVVTVAATDATASETGDPGTFTITRTGDAAAALTVYYTLGGSSLHAADYHRLSGIVTIAAGETTATVTVVPIDDTIGETAQTILFQLRATTAYQVGAPASATVTLNDNDLPAISVNPLDGVATEPASGTATDPARFRIYRAGGSAAFTVNYTISGSAVAGTDYTSVGGSVAFAAGDVTKDITVTPLLDADFENSETVTLTLTPDANYQVEPESSATVQILDQDQIAVSVSTEDTTVSETSTQIRFWVSRSGSTTAALNVTYAMSGTATSGADYTGATGTVTIPAAASGVYLTLTPVNDTLAEGTETVTINVTPVGGTYGARVASATYLLGDNDTAGLPQVRFSAGTSSGAESIGATTVPVTLSVVSASTVTVAYTINGGSATGGDVDYTLANGTLTFDPGVTALSIPFSVIDDIRPEVNETIVITLSAPKGATLGTSSHTFTINDNDTAPGVTVGFAAATAGGFESVTPAPIFVSLTAPATTAVTVDYTVAGGTATSGSDFALANGTLTFAVGQTSKILPNLITNDTDAESAETIIVTLSNPTNAALGPNTTHTYTINDDDASTVTITANDPEAREAGGQTGQFTVTRAGTTTGALIVNFTVSGTATNSSDYSVIGSTVSIAAGSASTTVIVTPADDSFDEGDETVVLTLGSGAYTIGASDSATVTIVDNERGVTITATDAAGSESGDPGLFRVSRTGDTTAELTVNLSTSGTATSGSDYDALPASVTILAGELFTTVPLTPLDDSIGEGSETVIATIAPGAYDIGSPSVAAVTITDNEPVVTITASDAAAAEVGPNPGTFTVSRTGSTAEALLVNLSSGGTAVSGSDYEALPVSVTIPAGSASANVPLTPIDDVLPEIAETVIVAVTTGASYVIGAPASATVTIADDDMNTAPVIAITSPANASVAIPASVGLVLEATVTDDNKPAPPVVTSVWSRVSGPGTVTFGNASLPNTTATFSVNGRYVLRLTASDGALQATSDLTVQAGPFTGSWIGQNIGGTPAGSFSQGAGNLTVTGGGPNITGATDGFYFVTQSPTGNCEIRARVASMTASSNAKAGVMIRGSAATNSKMGYMFLYGAASGSSYSSFRYRTTDGGTAASNPSTVPRIPYWVRLVLQDGTLTGYQSADGQNWGAAIGSFSFGTTPTSVLAGLAVTGGTTNASATAVFDNVTVSTLHANVGPLVNAGANLNVTVQSLALLNGTVTDDGEPTIPGQVSTEWSRISGPGTVTFGDAAELDTSAMFSAAGNYVLRLIADDGEVRTFDDLAVTAALPTVSVQASTPSATEQGLAPGALKLTRTGSTDTALTVQFALSGTAAAGADFADPGASAVFAIGDRDIFVPIAPLADTLAEGNETAILTLNAAAAYTVGVPASATVTIADLPIDAWRAQKFGAEANNPTIAGDLANPDGDLLANLLEYLTGGEPMTAGEISPTVSRSGNELMLTYSRSLGATDVQPVVEWGADLLGWSTSGITEEIVSPGETIEVRRARVDTGTAPGAFIRLRAVRP